MSFQPDDIVHNAQQGEGPCAGCPAQGDTNGEFVNPGLLNPDGSVMILTMDPSHRTEWNRYDDWADYNADKGPQFKESWRGGRAITKLLSPLPNLSIEDVWLADAVKCPVNNDLAGDVDTDEAFEHCVAYLKEEVETVDPDVIITMGNDPAEQLLRGVFNIDPGDIKAGTSDCGRTFETNPPVVISPHWANGWLGRHNNRQKVREAVKSVRRSEKQTGDQVFLVPCDSPNFDTVRKGIDLTKHPDSPSELAGRERVRVWGARVGEANESYFDSMTPGDLVVFYHDGSYIGVGYIGSKFRDDANWVSSTFWGDAPSKLIYTIEDFTEIGAPRSGLHSVFGYSQNYYPQGLTRVADDRVNHHIESIKTALERRYATSD